MSDLQACKLIFRLIELTSCLCSDSALAVCFEGRITGLDATETGNDLSQPKFEFTGLRIYHLLSSWQQTQPYVVKNKAAVGSTNTRGPRLRMSVS